MQIRKFVVRTFGDANQLRIENTTIGEPRSGEARVRLLATAVSGADVNMRRGLYPFQPKAPLTPGYSIVGRVEQIGPGASDLRVGARVACMTVTGGYSEQLHLPIQHLVPVPDGVSDSDAVCLILDGMTAFQMIRRSVRLVRGNRVFIHGASGAVGSALAQFGRELGLELYGTASAAKHEAVRALGVEPFDYRDTKWVDALIAKGGVDAVFDPLGYESFDRSWSILRRGGVLVGYGFNNQGFQNRKSAIIGPFLRHFARNLRFWTGKRATFYGIQRGSKTFRPDLTELLEKTRAGNYKPLIKASFTFEQIPAAHRAWDAASGIGSIVVTTV